MAYVQEDMRTINLATCPFAVCSYTTSTPSTSSSSSSPSSRSMPAIRARVTGFHDKSSKATCVVLRFFDRCEVGEWFLRLSDAAAMTDRQTRGQHSGRCAGLISFFNSPGYSLVYLIQLTTTSNLRDCSFPICIKASKYRHAQDTSQDSAFIDERFIT